jgi:hypothetical protein
MVLPPIAYYPYWRHLLSEFDVVVFDFRNHGRTSSHAFEPPLTPSSAAISNSGAGGKGEARRKKTAGDLPFDVGAHRDEARHRIGWRWDALVLFDPQDVPPQGHPLYTARRSVREQLTEWARAAAATSPPS